ASEELNAFRDADIAFEKSQTPEQRADHLLEVTRKLYADCVAAGEHSAATTCLRVIGSLEGVTENRQKQDQIEDGATGMDPDMIRARMRELWARKSTHTNAQLVGLDLNAPAEAATRSDPSLALPEPATVEDVIEAEIVAESPAQPEPVPAGVAA